MSTPNAEDLVVEFKNQSGNGYLLFFNKLLNCWVVASDNNKEWLYLKFELLREAEACAEALKNSI